MRKVETGPRNRERSHHASPLLPLDCARPALIKESVNQPTAYSPVFEFMFAAQVLSQESQTVDY